MLKDYIITTQNGEDFFVYKVQADSGQEAWDKLTDSDDYSDSEEQYSIDKLEPNREVEYIGRLEPSDL